MMKLKELVTRLDEYLDVDSIRDYCPKGLQVEGGEDVEKVIVGVSACVALFEEAVSKGAQTVLVHHGMLWDSDPKVVRGSLKERLKILLSNDISLLGYHLPLDCHPEVGNNIGLIRSLGLMEEKPFGDYNGKALGFMGKPESSMSIGELMERVKKRINPDARHHGLGSGKVSKIAICSGGAPALVRDAIAVGADVYLTGEDSEWIYHIAREEKIHYIAAGHHATEKPGPMALTAWINDNLAVSAEFVDIPNPI